MDGTSRKEKTCARHSGGNRSFTVDDSFLPTGDAAATVASDANEGDASKDDLEAGDGGVERGSADDDDGDDLDEADRAPEKTILPRNSS